jgi:hypothetical protein
MLAGLGYELGHHAVVVAQTISHYGLWISIGLIVVIVFFQIRSQRHMLRVAAQVRPTATDGHISPNATGGQVSPAAQASGDEAAS